MNALAPGSDRDKLARHARHARRVEAALLALRERRADPGRQGAVHHGLDQAIEGFAGQLQKTQAALHEADGHAS